MLHLSGGLLSTSRDCRKVNMEPGEWSQQLTSSLTWTRLVQAAVRRAESMTGQNLWQTGLHQNICGSSNKLNLLNFWLLRIRIAMLAIICYRTNKWREQTDCSRKILVGHCGLCPHLSGCEYWATGRKSMTEIKTNFWASSITDRMAARSSVRPRAEIWGGALWW